jgi:hypothetical protein
MLFHNSGEFQAKFQSVSVYIMHSECLQNLFYPIQEDLVPAASVSVYPGVVDT